MSLTRREEQDCSKRHLHFSGTLRRKIRSSIAIQSFYCDPIFDLIQSFYREHMGRMSSRLTGMQWSNTSGGGDTSSKVPLAAGALQQRRR